jgi:hypothetical protein
LNNPGHSTLSSLKRRLPGAAAAGFLSFQLINNQMTHEQLMEAASFLIAKGVGGGESLK